MFVEPEVLLFACHFVDMSGGARVRANDPQKPISSKMAAERGKKREEYGVCNTQKVGEA